ncbi:hypothetical protein DPMN_102522 [Dreissena polymorpha]|uniref:Uncharacterized protein n=1 Tax=Dreissena polymorpha TaxID=45954 RepID=A0A9D4LKN1_DREPO|nr:hypothetical protein DPMN_102522 [Dreissena polymorpha]
MEGYVTVIKGQRGIEFDTIEGCDAGTLATEAGVTEVNATVSKGQHDTEFVTMEGRVAVTLATEAGVTAVNATVIKGQQDIELVTMEGRDCCYFCNRSWFDGSQCYCGQRTAGYSVYHNGRK